MALNEKFTAFQKSMWSPFLELVAMPRPAGTVEQRLKFLEEEVSVKEVLNRYTHGYDSSDLDMLMTVFHPDCVIVNPRGTYRGRENIKINYAYMLPARRFSFHCVFNATVRIADSGCEAGMTAYFQDVSFLPSGGIKATGGSYVSRLLKTDGAWQFIEARFTNNFQHRLAPDSTADQGASLAPTSAAPAPSAPDNSREWVGPGATA